MIDTASYPLRPPAAARRRRWAVGGFVVLALVAGLLWWWAEQRSVPPVPAAVPAPAPVVAAPAPLTIEAPAPEPKPVAGPLTPDGWAAALDAIFGHAQVTARLRVDDFARRVVATVDNLPRAQAPASLWPVRPTGGRFAVVERTGGRLAADPDNAARYTPFVLLAEKTDSAALVALYARALPLLQQAYAELGYPNQRFHTRLLAVIDHLLAAPDAPEVLPLVLTEVKGEIPSTRPWLRYEFADAAFESASAGHRIMLRVGATNERRLKAKLRELRAELVRQAQG
jgi:hypothetical protein